jgi:hypothetical protein
VGFVWVVVVAKRVGEVVERVAPTPSLGILGGGAGGFLGALVGLVGGL